MAPKKLKAWKIKRKILRNKNLATFAVQEARRILAERNEELLKELRKTVREEVISTGPKRPGILVSIGRKYKYDPIKYKYLDKYHAEIGHKGDIAKFIYTKIGKTMFLTDLSVGLYHSESGLRRLGIAKLMIEIAKEIAQREGLLAIRISSDPSKPWLKDMYKKMGFIPLSETQRYAEMIYFLDEDIKAKFDPQKPWDILKYLNK